MSKDIQLLLAQGINEELHKAILEKILFAFRNSSITVSRKDFLSMKHGSVSAAQKIYKNLRNCSCSKIWPEGELKNYDSYQKCSVKVNNSNRQLSVFSEPSWSDQSNYELNPTVSLELI
ncbi:hypothetical protein H0A36_20590 [Endozoicomonas sp. SM1973]|uniref:Uncharacterized protein n=1 Tax=Spartinivicinus marinus TaxID=2994442 RepID=A0A853ICZ3_9GAMM|nr:hypothetical protein [Spartinivicinus marinus]MCX4028219.1 hypothetical protein [Spartinivicinus marinus]NYZ68418.1 hypothetical protein [Spartinivicinus marinus]